MNAEARGRRAVYLDWNATAPLRPEALAAMMEAAGGAEAAGANPSSQHGFGRAARGRLETARRQVAEAIGAEPDQTMFCSGATEAANLVLRQPWTRILYAATEHDCVRAPAAASGVGAPLPVDGSGVLRLDALEAALAEAALAEASAPETLVAVQVANNETGARQPIEEVARVARRHEARLLLDAAQALGKIPFDFAESGADFALFSGHKIGGPSGVGALAIGAGRALAPMLLGGGQELRRRSGTENLLGAIGFGAAAAGLSARSRAWAETAALRDGLEMRLKNEAPGLVFFADAISRLPNTSCFAAPGWRAETQLMRLDLAGYAVSAGSACSSGKMASSHVIEAMGFDAEHARSAIRVSLGPETTEAEVDGFAQAFAGLTRRRG